MKETQEEDRFSGFYPPSLDRGGSYWEWKAPWSTENYGVLREPFKDNSIVGLISAFSGSKIVAISYNNKITMIDADTKTVEKELALFEDETPGAILEINPGVIVVGTQNTIYKVDLKRGVVTDKKVLSGTLFGPPVGSRSEREREFVIGPDGYICLHW